MNEYEIDEVMFLEEDYDVSHAYWDLEAIGVKNEADNLENLQIIDSFNKTIIQDKDRYEVSWPWKDSKYELPSNYSLAEARLRTLMKNYKKDEFKREYNDIISKQLQDGIIEVANCTKEYLQRDEVVTHYIPHHSVINEDNGNTKLRIVYEGCAKTNKSTKSLNECLHRGPNLISNICGVLLRFRVNKIALIADIKKAYLQLQLNPYDRDRFLWVKDISKEVSKDNIQEFRFCRVIWGIICSAFLLAYTIFYHLHKYKTPVSNDISKNIYVDNLISGTRKFKTAMNYYKETKEIFSKASMNMCKWSSNHKMVMNSINVEDRCEDNVLKVLGLIWYPELCIK